MGLPLLHMETELSSAFLLLWTGKRIPKAKHCLHLLWLLRNNISNKYHLIYSYFPSLIICNKLLAFSKWKRESKPQKRHMYIHKIIIQIVLDMNLNFLKIIHLHPDNTLLCIGSGLSNINCKIEIQQRAVCFQQCCQLYLKSHLLYI